MSIHSCGKNVTVGNSKQRDKHIGSALPSDWGGLFMAADTNKVQVHI